MSFLHISYTHFYTLISIIKAILRTTQQRILIDIYSKIGCHGSVQLRYQISAKDGPTGRTARLWDTRVGERRRNTKDGESCETANRVKDSKRRRKLAKDLLWWTLIIYNIVKCLDEPGIDVLSPAREFSLCDIMSTSCGRTDGQTHDDSIKFEISKIRDGSGRHLKNGKIATILQLQFELFRLHLTQWHSSTFLTVVTIKV